MQGRVLSSRGPSVAPSTPLHARCRGDRASFQDDVAFDHNRQMWIQHIKNCEQLGGLRAAFQELGPQLLNNDSVQLL